MSNDAIFSFTSETFTEGVTEGKSGGSEVSKSPTELEVLNSFSITITLLSNEDGVPKANILSYDKNPLSSTVIGIKKYTFIFPVIIPLTYI